MSHVQRNRRILSHAKRVEIVNLQQRQWDECQDQIDQNRNDRRKDILNESCNTWSGAAESPVDDVLEPAEKRIANVSKAVWPSDERHAEWQEHETVVLQGCNHRVEGHKGEHRLGVDGAEEDARRVDAVQDRSSVGKSDVLEDEFAEVVEDEGRLYETDDVEDHCWEEDNTVVVEEKEWQFEHVGEDAGYERQKGVEGDGVLIGVAVLCDVEEVLAVPPGEPFEEEVH